MLITIEGATSTATLAGAITVKVPGSITALDNRAVFKPEFDEYVKGATVMVNTINGVSPNAGGEFFLSGSECTSWDRITGGTAWDGEAPAANVPITGDTKTTGIWLTDLCPACSDCDTLYRLKQETELLKMWLTLLKDVNLYGNDPWDENSSDDDTGIANGTHRHIYKLWQKRLEELPECGEYILGVSGSTFADFYQNQGFTKSLQLIQQYMTTVHMWNYLVNRNNKSDLIQIAPEDTAGFSVQTKRALTSCGSSEAYSGQSIQCNIKIADAVALFDDGSTTPLYEVSSSYPVSVFIPKALLSFEPFDDKQSAVGIPPETHDQVAGTVYNIDILQADPNVDEAWYCRSVDTGVIPATAAGTYVVYTKFLPFVYSVMKDANGDPISIRGGTVYSDSFWKTTTGSTISFSFFAEDSEPEYLPKPTATEYLDAKTAPTCSVNFKIIWHIVITWTIGGYTSPEVEDYYYTCNGVRRYYSAPVLGPSVIDISGGTESQV